MIYMFYTFFKGQFNAYVIKLRGEYNTKVATFRHVMESHQADFQSKQKFYEEAIRVRYEMVLITFSMIDTALLVYKSGELLVTIYFHRR